MSTAGRKYALVDWERNGYDDSDFFLIYFDAEKGTIENVMTGSTRFGGGLDMSEFKWDIPPSQLERARILLRDHVLKAITEAEKRDVNEPSNVEYGTVVRFLCDSRARNKNPYKAGQKGDVFWVGAFGQFYRNGYNHPGRANRRVGVRLLDGTKVFAPLKDLRLDREMLSEKELYERAEDLSRHYNFGAMFAGFTWASKVATPVTSAAAEANKPGIGPNACMGDAPREKTAAEQIADVEKNLCGASQERGPKIRDI